MTQRRVSDAVALDMIWDLLTNDEQPISLEMLQQITEIVHATGRDTDL